MFNWPNPFLFSGYQTIDLLHLILDKISGMPILKISFIESLEVFSKKYSLVFSVFLILEISEIFLDLKKPSMAF